MAYIQIWKIPITSGTKKVVNFDILSMLRLLHYQPIKSYLLYFEVVIVKVTQYPRIPTFESTMKITVETRIFACMRKLG